jgi:hypothetical protein
MLDEPMTTPSEASSPKEIIIISHSPIFYWWPVWAVGFLMALWTYFDGHLMAVVPLGTVAERERVVGGHDDPRDVLVIPPGARLPVDRATGAVLQPRLRMAAGNGPGMIFATTLCLVIVITNIHLRGLWSVLAILGIISATILLALLGWWDPILRAIGIVDVHINALGYFSIALFVFAIWSIIVLVYDRQLYLIFSRGQLRVRTAIGAGEKTYDTFGIMVEKHTDDLFRHWLLGFGSGDMTVRTAGTNAQQFEVANVLRVGRKLELIQQMLQERAVVGGSA